MRDRYVVVVDDEPYFGEMCRRKLEAEGAKVAVYESAFASLRAFESPDVDLALIDVMMMDMSGFKLCRLLEQQQSPPPMLLITGIVAPDDLLKAASIGSGIPVLAKTDGIPAIIETARKLLRSPTGLIRVEPLAGRLRVGRQTRTGLARMPLFLLKALLEHPKGATREMLLGQVWPGRDNLNLVDVTMGRLREILREFPGVQVEAIGNGYRLVLRVANT